MLSTEKAFEIVPYFSDIYEKLEVKKFIETNQITIKEDDDFKVMMLGIGLDIGNHILKNFGKIKDEIYIIVSIIDDIEVEEVKKQSFVKTLNTFKDLFKDKDTVDFLSSVVK